MIRKDVRDAYYEFSGKASDNVRQLGFAALAVIWIFKPAATTGISLPERLLWSGVFAVTALAADFLQYLYATVAWGIVNYTKEQSRVEEDKPFRAPRHINWPTNILFALKALAVAISYVLLLQYLLSVLHPAAAAV
jgi:hypothetical protein